MSDAVAQNRSPVVVWSIDRDDAHRLLLSAIVLGQLIDSVLLPAPGGPVRR